jgi:uncharacterized protein (TIGR00297 family)
LAATPVGGAILAGTGPRGATALLAFFGSSSMLGRLPQPRAIRQRRGNERDAVQVLANGGVAAALAITARYDPSGAALAAFGGALATATADTWATEIGTRTGGRPRSVLTGRPVPAGASGGVSLCGSVAAVIGAAFIATVLSARSRGTCRGEASLWSAVALGGVVGAFADSALGAAVQEVRACSVCGEETELDRHCCGHPTIVVRGIAGFDNDVVNFTATLVGAATAAIVAESRSTRSAARMRYTREQYGGCARGGWRPIPGQG